MSGFVSTNDMAEKTVSFDELGAGLYAYTAEGDPNSGIIVGPDGVTVVDAQATPAMAAEVQARIFTDWPDTIRKLQELGAEKMVPGRGRALMNAKEVKEALDGTAAFTSRLFATAKAGVAAGRERGDIYADAMEKMRPEFGHWVIFEHCMPFNVARAVDEARGHDHPRIWTAERDIEMWKSLEGTKAKTGEIG